MNQSVINNVTTHREATSVPVTLDTPSTPLTTEPAQVRDFSLLVSIVQQLSCYANNAVGPIIDVLLNSLPTFVVYSSTPCPRKNYNTVYVAITLANNVGF